MLYLYSEIKESALTLNFTNTGISVLLVCLFVCFGGVFLVLLFFCWAFFFFPGTTLSEEGVCSMALKN